MANLRDDHHAVLKHTYIIILTHMEAKTKKKTRNYLKPTLKVDRVETEL